jgi:hypothetical protein
MSYRIYRFGSTQILPRYNISQDTGTGEARIDGIDAPHGGAYDNLGSEQAVPGGYDLVISGNLVGKDKADLQSQNDDLRSYLGKRERLFRNGYQGNAQWVWARLRKISARNDGKFPLRLPVDLYFYVYSSLWNGEKHGSWRFDDGYAFDDGLSFDTALIYTLTNAVTTVVLNNGGNGAVRAFDFAITPAGSPITQVKIEKVGKTSMVWAGSVAVGTQLAINFGAMSILNHGANAYSGLTLTANHKIDGWMTLEPGDNMIVVVRSGGSASSKLAISFDDGWV